MDNAADMIADSVVYRKTLESCVLRMLFPDPWKNYFRPKADALPISEMYSALRFARTERAA
jgi:hypothetical protein